MPDSHALLIFIAAGWLLNLTPGPDVLYIVSHTVRSGRRAGILAGLGIAAGCLVHVCGAALGVGALLAGSAAAFAALKWLGAAYLMWIGLRMLCASAPGAGAIGQAAAGAGADAGTLRAVFIGGFWTNVLNPKVALFFLAFVPQFIAPGSSAPALAFVLLGLLFVVCALPVNALWALAAHWLLRRAAARSSSTARLARALRWPERVAGLLFMGFGLKLAFSAKPV